MVPAESSPRLLALHGLRLKGVAEAAVLAEMMDVPADDLHAELERLEDGDLVTYRYGRMAGYQLTPEGRAMWKRLLEDELAETGARPAIDAAYTDFRGVNDRLLGVCTAWQIRDIDGERVANDHLDTAYDDGVRGQLVELHGLIEPVLDALGAALARFGGHQRRLRHALERVQAGDHDYFTKPMFPSYHSSWFELHEDLLATLGRERSSERGEVHADEGSH